MAFCINCGQELIDGAKFCSGCGVKLSVEEGAKRKIVYEGEIHKCPQCGEVLDAFVVNCPSCGYELRGTQNSTVVREFAAKLEDIEKTRPSKKFGVKMMLENQTEVSETDLKKISLIKSFAIPNTKEDMLEFLIMASSNINLQRYNDFDTISESEKAVSDAWEAKFEQAYEKAKVSFGHTPEFQKITTIYENKSGQIKKSKNRRIWMWIIIPIAVLSTVALGILGMEAMFNSGHNECKKENERLEAIVVEIYDAIEEENFILARAKAATLLFSVHNGYESEYVETWNEKRENMLSVIDAAEQENAEDIITDETMNGN